MFEIDKRLEERETAGHPIRVALVGAGQMGTEIVTTVGEMVGMDIVAVVDLSEERAIAGYRHSQKKSEIIVPMDLQEAERVVNEGRVVAGTDYRLATTLRQVEVVIDATGSTEMGAQIALDAIDHQKHIVMMNVECDVTIGPILYCKARNAGVIYSLAAGDEPAAIIELYRFAKALGFTIVAAGKGKNNPLNIYATPETEEERARARDMSARMLCEFVDGSKTVVEMAAVSNATGLVPDIRGMHGAESTVDTLKSVFCPIEDGGVLEQIGVVDFAIGVHPGVFLIIRTDAERLRAGLVQRDMGDGPYYQLFRPYHLCSIEVPLTVAQIALYGESSGHPRGPLVSECFAVAKRDLKRGERLDGIGGYCYRGSIDNADVAWREGLLPLGIAQGCVVKKDVVKDTAISYDMVDIVDDSILLDLRRQQDSLYR